MRYVIIGAISLALSTAQSAASGPAAAQSEPNAQAAVDALIAADKAFASANAAATGAEQMAAMFAPDAMTMAVPEPGFAIGPAESAARITKVLGDNKKGSANWSPVRAGVSADGTQGFTLGYFTVARGGKDVLQAKYLSYWVKGDDGWKVRLYKLVPRDIAAIPTTKFPPLLPAATAAIGSGPNDSAASLAAAEKAFSDAAQTEGLRQYFQKLGRPDSLHTLASNDFLLGNIAIGEAHPEGPSPLHWKADDVVIASSGDLGATYGYLDRNGPTPPGRLARIPFFTIWYREAPDAPWRYVAE